MNKAGERHTLRRDRWISLALCMALFPACNTTTKQVVPDAPMRYQVPSQALADTGFPAWVSGDEAAALAASQPQQDAALSPEALFVKAEVALWDGDVERAFDSYIALLTREPSHPLARFAAARVHDLHDDVIDFHERARAALSGLRYSDVHPLTASYLAMIGQRAAYNDWYVSRRAEPFSGESQGLPQRWRYTPRLSPFRLGDFDTPLAPEKEASLKASYLNPVFAENVPVNIDPVRPYVAPGISLSPGLGGPGIYYMESFATVTASEPQTYWIYGNFVSAARLFIDGQEVMAHAEKDYQSGKRWRRVTLSPGTHRVLLKLGYQPNYRDWFDLAFLNRDATMMGGSQLTFSELPPEGGATGKVTLLSDVKLTPELEPVLFTGDELARASDFELYLTALAAHYDREAELFEPAYQELLERAPEFAALHGLRSLQIQTLWEVPAKLRDANGLTELRRAHELDPESMLYSLKLGNWLQSKGKDRETQRLLEQARDNAVATDADGEKRVRNILALNTWASYLDRQDWDEPAEQAWRAALEAAPTNCGAAYALQASLYGRRDYQKPEAITPAADKCPLLYENWVKQQPDAFVARAELAEREALRYPYDANKQVDFARALDGAGQKDRALAVLEQAKARMPWSAAITSELADRAFAQRGEQAAHEVLQTYADTQHDASWVRWQMADLEDNIPLQDLMSDGRKIAFQLAEREPVTPGVTSANSGGDEAFYAIDFAARQYFEDGSSLTLTHTMVRVMTKNAIDRFGEMEVPGGAKVIVARTIKQDGSVQVPAQVDGKETLSMPGLAEGDFVELAYLDYDGASSISRSRRVGTRFFFKMKDISSLHSEYVVISPSGEFLERNAPPAAERFQYHGVPAVRYLKENSPRPRDEPNTVSAEEYLPWVQLMADGATLSDFELGRRSYGELIRDNMRLSPEAREMLQGWISARGEMPLQDQIPSLFYEVTHHFSAPSESLGSDLTHGLLTREGNPLLALKATYDLLGVESDIFTVKSVYQNPTPHPMTELDSYGEQLLRVKMPMSSEQIWLDPSGQDAMFGAIEAPLIGQPAICVTCAEPEETTVPSDGAVRRDGREQKIVAKLLPDGKLVGQVRQTYDGESAIFARKVLRSRMEETQRAKFIEALIAEHIPGATVTNFNVLEGSDRSRPITFVIDFEREQFARQVGNGLRLEAALFVQPLGSLYAKLPSRTTPMLVGRARHYHDVFEIELPQGLTPSFRSKSGEWTMQSPFGTYTRTSKVENGKLILGSDIAMEIQRVSPKDYAKFQQWAIAAEQSSVVLLDLQ